MEELIKFNQLGQWQLETLEKGDKFNHDSYIKNYVKHNLPQHLHKNISVTKTSNGSNKEDHVEIYAHDIHSKDVPHIEKIWKHLSKHPSFEHVDGDSSSNDHRALYKMKN